MIKGISPTGRYISISGGNSSGPYISPGSTGAGMVRWNSNMSQLEINDGNSWLALSTNYASVGLTEEAICILDWANKKMVEELQIIALADKHPAVAIALENLNKVKQQLDATIILSKDHEKTTS
jgi:hypothetical protein